MFKIERYVLLIFQFRLFILLTTTLLDSIIGCFCAAQYTSETGTGNCCCTLISRVTQQTKEFENVFDVSKQTTFTETFNLTSTLIEKAEGSMKMASNGHKFKKQDRNMLYLCHNGEISYFAEAKKIV